MECTSRFALQGSTTKQNLCTCKIGIRCFIGPRVIICTVLFVALQFTLGRQRSSPRIINKFAKGFQDAVFCLTVISFG